MPIDRPSKWGYVLLPLAAPHRPPRGAGPLRALHTGGRQQLSPLPAAVEATTSLGCPIGNSVGRRVRILRRDLDRLLADAEASATSASQRGADAGEGWPDAQQFWGGP